MCGPKSTETKEIMKRRMREKMIDKPMIRPSAASTTGNVDPFHDFLSK